MVDLEKDSVVSKTELKKDSKRFNNLEEKFLN